MEINEYYKNEPKFNGVYSRNNLPNKIKNGAYVINLDEYENTGTHWVSLFFKTNEAIYFDSFGIEHIPKEINKFINNDTTKSNNKLAKNKLNTIDTLLSCALNDSKISHEEFSNIITEANIYQNIKENIKELTTEPSTKEKLTTL